MSNRSEPGQHTIYVANDEREIVAKLFVVAANEHFMREFVADYNDAETAFMMFVKREGI